MLQSWTKKRRANLKEVQSLLGKLNFAASTVRSGRVFVSRIIEEIKKFDKNGKSRNISKNMLKDINWWLTFMEQFDGKTIIPPAKFASPESTFSTDSCLTGCGGWSFTEHRAFHAEFPDWIQNREDVHINEK